MMAKKILTVCGFFSPENIGFTLPHEHLLVDVRNWLSEIPVEEIIKGPITLENRGDIIYKSFYYEDNLFHNNIDETINEVLKFKEKGGKTIVDLTVGSMGRDPLGLLEISKKVGINVVIGSGNYVVSSWSDNDKKKNERELAKEIINEFSSGIMDTKIKPGVIGEIGISDINNCYELKSVRASALAQREIGCAINFHLITKYGHKIMDILKDVGSDLNKVIFSHCDYTLKDCDYHNSLAKRGAYIEYDGFGVEVMGLDGNFTASDGERIESVLIQINKGNIEKILISHDISFKMFLTKWGGFGYGHIMKNILPRMQKKGLSKDQISRITIENPGEVFAF